MLKLFDFLFNRVRLKITTNDVNLLPVKASKDAVGLDVKASTSVTIPAGKTVKIPLGIAVECPVNYEVQIRNRSGLGSKGLIIPNGLGTIDPDYRGEICMILYNSTDTDYKIHKYDRVGQLVVNKVPRVKLIQVTQLTQTARGTSGFGSTGVK